MRKPTEQDINDMYSVLVEGSTLHEVRPDIFDEDDDDSLEIISPDYVNRLGKEYGERVIYWEQNYDPSYERMGENDGEKEKEIIETLVGYGVDFETDLVAKYPGDYKENK